MSIIDILIILIAVVCAVFAVKYFTANSKKAYNVPEVSYVVELKSLSDEYLDVFKEGRQNHRRQLRAVISEALKKLRLTDNVETREDAENGRFVQSSFENRKDVYLTISGVPTTYTDDEILFATQEIKIGKQLHMKSKNYVGHGYIISVNDGK